VIDGIDVKARPRTRNARKYPDVLSGFSPTALDKSLESLSATTALARLLDGFAPPQAIPTARRDWQ
jgi:hypothetical protein